MTIFSRNIAVDIDEGTEGTLLVKSRMVDRFHDISVLLTVSNPGFTILDVEVEMAVAPDEGCNLVYPLAKKLVGLSIAGGFNRRVVSILAGANGCSNVLNMVLVAAPLAINAAQLLANGGKKGSSNYLKGTCIAHL
ncbi:MAG: DUF2889 domain-containing protein [Dehalococcoidia bacterium]|nr:DUF2889 domain-containing protein [Dehalococcoidia bacterium]